MCCSGRRDMAGALVAKARKIEAVHEVLAGSEEPGSDRNVQLVDEPCLEVLTDRRHAAADLHVLSARCLGCSVKCLASATGDEVKHRAAFHLDRLARVMRQHEYRAVIRWILPPPSAPRVVGPRATNRAE